MIGRAAHPDKRYFLESKKDYLHNLYIFVRQLMILLKRISAVLIYHFIVILQHHHKVLLTPVLFFIDF